LVVFGDTETFVATRGGLEDVPKYTSARCAQAPGRQLSATAVVVDTSTAPFAGAA
jgi:hypothetical protein